MRRARLSVLAGADADNGSREECVSEPDFDTVRTSAATKKIHQLRMSQTTNICVTPARIPLTRSAKSLTSCTRVVDPTLPT